MTLGRSSMTISHLPMLIIYLTARPRKWGPSRLACIHFAAADFSLRTPPAVVDQLRTSIFAKVASTPSPVTFTFE